MFVKRACQERGKTVMNSRILKKSISTLAILISAGVFIMTWSYSSHAASKQAAEALTGNPALQFAPDSVLVRFKTSATQMQKMNARALVLGKKIRGYGLVKRLEHLQLSEGVRVENALKRLRQLPFVEYAEPDYVLRADSDDTYYSLQWGLNNTGQQIRGIAGIDDADIDAQEAWTISTGDPTFVVAIIDSGVEYSHEDLAGNMWMNPGEIPGDGIDNDGNGFVDDVYGWDFFSNDSNPMDEEGHGTHVAGTVCAEGDNGIGVSGVAWQCRIMALRFLGPDGGFTSDAIAALNYAVDMGVKVSNNSWGGGGYSQSLISAIQNAGNSGHLFVAAAGNDGRNTDNVPHYPSAYSLDNIISVAATDNRDQLAGFSNYGLESVDIGAPGVDIASTMLSGYYWSSGTSMAAPHVTGVAALVFGAHPEWNYSQVRDRLYNTVRPVAALNGLSVTGGVVNAYAALLEPVSEPLAPSNLSATSLSDVRIDLAWSDNSDNEDGFAIERSTEGISWAEIGRVERDITSYSDALLNAETTYSYRVRAFNSAGYSAYSNSTSATTDPAPTSREINAGGEIQGAGSVTGTYQDTWYDDGTDQSITEQSSGGRKFLRYSYLEHTWTFSVPPGSVIFNLNAWSSPSNDGDTFVFSYSKDGVTFTDMVTVNGGSTADWHSYSLPPGTTGTVYVRVIDTDQTPGSQEFDTVYVDRMYILVEQQAGDPPVAPTNLTAEASAYGEIDLAWNDQSADEDGFEIERSEDSGATWNPLSTVAADSQEYVDTSVAPETTYLYRVRAYNGAGYSAYSNEAAATTMALSGLELSASGYKIKGWHYVDLAWAGTSLDVEIYRDGGIVARDVAGGSYTDGPIARGGGVYTYQVCESGTANCSNEIVVSF